MKILAFAASLREGSFNRRLLQLAAEVARQGSAEVREVHFRTYVCPYYDADVEDRDGVPEGAERLASDLRWADGLILSSPEYNNSLPGTLKNTIDWVSRIRPIPLRQKTGLLLGASDGVVGAARGLWQVRIPLERLGMALYPDMYTLPSGNDAFTETNTLVEDARHKRLVNLVTAYLKFAQALVVDDREDAEK